MKTHRINLGILKKQGGAINMNQNKRSIKDPSTKGQKEECGGSEPTRKQIKCKFRPLF
jgi:hypothetical protein